METFLNRYRNLTVLLAAILAQLVLLAYQIKSSGEVRLIRTWSLAAVTPMARVLENGRTGTAHWMDDYVFLVGARNENRRVKAELDRARMENQYLHTQLETAERASALALFEKQSPSKTIAARVIGNTTGVGARVVIIDRGASSGIEKGMAVIEPDGIVGKITGVYPNVSYVLLLTDSSFAAGVISQKNRVHGTLRGQGDGVPVVDRIQNEMKVEPGELFFTSGDDRIFPKGLPVGQVSSVKAGKSYQEIQLTPSGLKNGVEEVLVVIQGVHGKIPDVPPPAAQSVRLLDPPPPDGTAEPAPEQAGPLMTDADRMMDRYRKIGAASGHVYGQSSNGAPNYNININPPAATPQAGSTNSAPAPANR